MFKLTPNPTFWAKAQLSIPGEAKPVTIEVQFRHLGRDAMREFFESLDGKTDIDALGSIVTGWRGVDAEFSQENLAALLDNYPTSALSLFNAFRREAIEAKEKN